MKHILRNTKKDSQLSRLITARWSSTGLVTVGPTKVKAVKSTKNNKKLPCLL